MKFTKMHGLGNDYVYVDTFEQSVPDPAAMAIAVSRPHFGVGADGLVLIGPSTEADYAMRMFNADGSEGEMCGNAVRCIGKYVHDRGLTAKTRVTLATRGGIKTLELQLQGGSVEQVTVDLGEPALSPASLPVTLAGAQVLNHPLSIDGQTHHITCVSMGNPHAVIFVDDPRAVDVHGIGRQIEHHPLFPKRTNVEFVRVWRRDLLEMRVWERGSGETLACGTGAAASLVAAVLNGLADRSAVVQLTGGELHVHWDARDNHVYQTGPATFVFDGVWLGA
ncbi:MAG TPA: diaminopimelate epimerase [Ottowia sp.]|nr:diaminopimelate epimerase [Ottowia sp.]HOM19873.1 diaminopimelate epimerase [Ottowia sp.]HPP96843.1 diaminopimelate epimerase [Ottowia sp.]